MFLYRLGEEDSLSTHNIKGGRFQNVHQDVFPALRGMALHRLSMEPGTLNPPHWHTNSHEIVFVISGTGLFGIRGAGEADDDVFKATEGDVVFIEQNASHWFKSIGEESLEVGVWFNNPNPTTLGLVSSLRGVPDAQVAQAYDAPPSAVVGINTDIANLLAGEVSAEELGFGNTSELKRNLYNEAAVSFDQPRIGKISKLFPDPEVFPRMRDFTLAHIIIQPGAMRQIHWHLIPNELNLVLAGTAEFGVVTPENTSYVYAVQPGDVIMAPVGYSHYAVNQGDKPFEFLLGFDSGDIAGVDVRQTLDNLPASVRAQTLKIGADKIDQLRTKPQRSIVRAPRDEGSC